MKFKIKKRIEQRHYPESIKVVYDIYHVYSDDTGQINSSWIGNGFTSKETAEDFARQYKAVYETYELDI